MWPLQEFKILKRSGGLQRIKGQFLEFSSKHKKLKITNSVFFSIYVEILTQISHLMILQKFDKTVITQLKVNHYLLFKL